MHPTAANSNSNILTNYELISNLLQAFQASYKTLILPTLTLRKALAVLPPGSAELIQAVYDLPPNVDGVPDLTEHAATLFVPTNHSIYAERFLRVTPSLLIAFQNMQKQLKKDTDEHIKIISGYRSPAYQALLLLGGYAQKGFDMVSTLRHYMPPGYSQHGKVNGLAIDVGHHYMLDENFQESAAYPWMITHAASYGFQLSYPDTQNNMMFEPWHWQFLPQGTSKKWNWIQKTADCLGESCGSWKTSCRGNTYSSVIPLAYELGFGSSFDSHHEEYSAIVRTYLQDLKFTYSDGF